MIRRILFIVLIFVTFGMFAVIMQQFKPDQETKGKAQKSPTPIERQTDLQVKSSIPYWDQKNAFSSFESSLKQHDHLNLFWYYLSEDGDVITYEAAVEDKKIIELAKENNITVFATITNLPEEGGWDSERVEDMLRTRASREAHIQGLIAKINDLEFDGINIDYEEVAASEKNRFSIFIEELAAALTKQDKLLSISLHPKRDGEEGLGAFQDWKRLSGSADQLSIMAFNEHYDEGRSGPVASTPWVEEIIAHAQSLQVPPEKIYLGIPLFGYDWNKDNDEAAEGLTYEDAVRLMSKYNVAGEWSSENKSPYFLYEQDGEEHEVWYENARSVREKVLLAENYGLAGISFWRLGGEDPKIWEEL